MNLLGEITAVATAVLWAGSSLAFAGATTRIGSIQVNVSRLLIASVALVFTVLVLNLSLAVTYTQIQYLAISGLIGLFFGDTFLFKSYEYISPRVSSLVMSSSPAITAFLAYFFLTESLTLLALLGMAITLSGISLVIFERKEKSSSHQPIHPAGVFYAFLGSLGQSGGLIYARMAFDQGPVNGLVATCLRVVSATLILIPITLLARKVKNPITVFRQDVRAFRLTILGTFLGPYLGITLSLLSIMYTDVAVAATLMSIVPIIMLPLVKILFKEVLTWRAILGACIAVAGVTVLFLR
ncbi:MAG: DMT family transporter [bacterium]